MNELVEQIGRESGKEREASFEIGDTVNVHVRIREGEKERIQIFTGTVISIKGGGINKSFTVRRIVHDEGVERVFPLNSPDIVDVVVSRHGRVKRAKLYYLRGRVGRGRRLAERRKSTGPGPEVSDDQADSGAEAEAPAAEEESQ